MTVELAELRPRHGNAVNVAADLAYRTEHNGWAGAPAFFADGRVWTHGQVHDLAARAATVLVDSGIRPGDRVFIALPDGIGWVITFLAVARVGAIAVLANPEITAADHAFLAGDCDAALCVTSARLEGRFDRRRWLDVERLLASAGGAARAGVQPVGARTPLYIQYTSGTTGEPKGVVHHHGDLPVYHDAIGGPVLAVQRADVTLSVSKLFFAYGFGNAFVFPLYSGSSAVLVGERPSADTVAELVARHRVTLLYAVPSAYAALVDRTCPDAFGSVRAAVSAGETLPPALGTRAAALLGAPVCEQIGSTEVGHAFCANTVHHNVPGTLGRPVPGYDIELRDPDGNPVADETPGQLWVRGPTLLREYLNRPADTVPAVALPEAVPRQHAGLEAVEKMAEEAEERNWVALHYSKDRSYRNDNIDLPTLQPWVLKTQPPSDRFIFERNPYYYRIDAGGPASLYRPGRAHHRRAPPYPGQGRLRRGGPAGRLSRFLQLHVPEGGGGAQRLPGAALARAKGARMALYPT